MTIRTLIVDDEPLARERLRTLLADEPDVAVVGECGNGREALRAITEQRPDLVFLDVQMPELDGFEVLRRLGGTGAPAIVFVTAYDQYALRAFDVHALDYLLKPFDRERFGNTLRRVRVELQRSAAGVLDDRVKRLLLALDRKTQFDQRLAIKSGGRISFVPTEEIEWIEAADNYVRLHTESGVHLLRSTMNEIEERLDPDQFVRIHRSAMVRIARIREIQPWFNGEYVVILRDGTKRTSSRGYRDRLHALIDTQTKEVNAGE